MVDGDSLVVDSDLLVVDSGLLVVFFFWISPFSCRPYRKNHSERTGVQHSIRQRIISTR